jgi:hypothetical protein
VVWSQAKASYRTAAVTGTLEAPAADATTGTFAPAAMPVGTITFTWYSPTKVLQSEFERDQLLVFVDVDFEWILSMREDREHRY